MPWEVLPMALSLLGVGVVVTLLLIAFAATVDPLAFTRCHDCNRWLINTAHRQEPVCFQCRHAHGHHWYSHRAHQTSASARR